MKFAYIWQDIKVEVEVELGLYGSIKLWGVLQVQQYMTW